MKIGIGITKCGREDVFKITFDHIVKNSVEDAYIFVHDDTDTRKGVAYSKNKCIEALMDNNCDILFLFDDDCYPISKGYEKRFIDSGLNHACATFTHYVNRQPNGNELLGIDPITKVEYFSNPCGIVLCYKRICIDAVGGMDINYGKWGVEHVGHSHRIFNAGLNPYRFAQPRRFMSFFYSFDQHKAVNSIVTDIEKKHELKIGRKILKEEKQSKEWKPYKM